ncbi:MAG: hypothetical protein A2161_01720 [Candidatus Schekmanbacteria bacterium RBG_13_48_7]|uniref:Uncharacterized protein n=1 Tax=Candidatus Schekmanbacteria bacterium RBG_13_48_7 TaxID=1817878 RepID=A0A1F7RM16_9BACT|nr:MAG: hypothetical protein A2161_01720 [Candidatus Schekmanbacteria bacterium RBG_13_48_7]
MQKRIILSVIFVIIFCSQEIDSCPTDYRRFDETYYLRDMTVMIDSVWMNNGHLFIVTFKGPRLINSTLKIFFTNKSSKKIISGETSLKEISGSVFRGYVFLENTELYGKGHIEISGRIAGSEEEGSAEIFSRDLKPFLETPAQPCY